MKAPAIFQREARKRLFQGIAFGGAATMTIGFVWGGWMTEESARIMRAAAENSGRMSVLVPLFVAQFKPRKVRWSDSRQAAFMSGKIWSARS